MKLAFYKGRKYMFNRLTAWWTNGPYSHVELVLDDGMSYSSSHRDGGVRLKKIEYSKTENWDFVEIGPETSEIRNRIKERLGRGYDYLGLFGFVLPMIKHSLSRDFCSETVLYVILGMKRSWRQNPNDMADYYFSLYPDNITIGAP